MSGVFRISKTGAKFLLASSAYTKGTKPYFSIFSFGEKKNFFAKGAWPYAPPPKYAIVGHCAVSFYLSCFFFGATITGLPDLNILICF